MKKLLPLLLLSLGLIGSAYAEICNEDSNVQSRNGIVFLPNKTKPFSGQNLCIYDNGQYKVNGEFTEGLKDGKWTNWAKNGIKKTEETFRLGEIQTKTIFSSEHYQKLETIVFKDDGKSEFKKITWDYFPNGQLGIEKNFQWGVKHGLWVSWYENGQMHSKGEFVNGEAEGVHNYWHENGQKWGESTLSNGNVVGTAFSWDEDGQLYSESKYINGEHAYSTEYFYYPNGQMKEMMETEEDDSDEWKHTAKFHGKRIEWYENGQKHYEVNYKHAKLDGQNISWHRNGQKRFEGNYIDDKLNGKLTHWYENGQKEIEGSFSKAGKQHGTWLSWYSDGTTRSQAEWNDGKGKETSWYKNGVKAMENNYINNRRDGWSLTWHQNGTQRSKQIFIKARPSGTQVFKYSNNHQVKFIYQCSDGLPVGEVQGWKLNGQSYNAGGFNAGSGKLLSLHENGNKEVEIYFRDGNQVSTSYWDENNFKKKEIIYERDDSSQKSHYRETVFNNDGSEVSLLIEYNDYKGLCSGNEVFEKLVLY